MQFDESRLVTRALGVLKSAKAGIARGVHNLVEARTRRLDHDEQFYRDLKSYCSAHNVSHVCEDDWKTRC